MNKPKFKLGDRVRITKKKTIFHKGYTPRWTEEIFSISQILYTDPPTYKIIDIPKEKKCMAPSMNESYKKLVRKYFGSRR